MPQVEKYGLLFPEGCTPASIELIMAFEPRFAKASGFRGRYEHLHDAIDLIWNVPRRLRAAEQGVEYEPRRDDAFIWNEWTEDMMREFCAGHWATTVWGPNASFKTGTAAVFILCAFYASPHNTAIVMTTTSLSGLRKRTWREVLRYHRLANGIGTVHASDFAIRYQKGSDESGIFGIATGQDEGDVQKAVDKIIGFHQTNVYAVVDEGQATNDAIVKACASLEAGTEHFQLIMLGNPDTELDSLGLMSEPIGGYETINVEMDRWEIKRGICIHLDGLDSPRVKEGEQFYPGLLTQRDIDSKIAQEGEDSPDFWRTRRGFIAPQGVQRTVLSATMIRKFRAREKPAVWEATFKMGAGLDPSFEGGDRCILRFGKCGRFADGPMGIELGEILHIKVRDRGRGDDELLHYQILTQVREACEQRGVGPDMLGMDSTGEGGGLAAIFMREWSRSILCVEFGGRASDMPVADRVSPDPKAKPRLAREIYLYRVTELWYEFRRYVMHGQMRGLDQETAVEFCQRQHEMRGNLIMVESKKEMKLRTKKSPDLADAAVVLAELFRQRFDLRAETTETQAASPIDLWRELAERYNVNNREMELDEALAD